MADPQAALANQLRNIAAKTGKTFAQLCTVISASGLAKISEQRTMLMEKFGLGYGDANTLALKAKEAAAPAVAADADPLDTIYAGPKAPLRVLHERLSAAIDKIGPYEKAPKKNYISMRRKKQFAMLGPATKTQIELGLNVKSLPGSPHGSARLKALPPGGMCQYSVRLSEPAEIDAELMDWIRAAYDSSG
jgi:Domain of unknown function (DUF5655)/Domain of unknown function (DUF4287)